MRIVVSGDYKREADPTCAAFEPLRLRHLISRGDVRSAGLPPCNAPARSTSCSPRKNYFQERTHLVGAYPLGKAQRIIALLRQAGYDRPIYIHGALKKITGLLPGGRRPPRRCAALAAGDRGALPRRIVSARQAHVNDLGPQFADPPPALPRAGCVCAPTPASAAWNTLVISDHADWDGLCATVDETQLPHAACYARRARRAGALLRGAGLEAAAAAHFWLWRRRSRETPLENRAVNRFATLLDSLAYEPSRLGKLRLMTDYFRTAGDPNRGFALAALTGALSFRHAKPALIRTLIYERVDPVLFDLSYDFVGDLSETVALLWPVDRFTSGSRALRLGEVIATLEGASKLELPSVLARLLDGLDETGRWALLKLITGALRVGVSARLAKQAVAELGGRDANAIEDLWHGLAPPYSTFSPGWKGASHARTRMIPPPSVRRCSRTP